MEQTRQIKLSIPNMAVYTLLLALVIFAYVLTNGYFLLAVLALMVILPAGSIVLTWKLAGAVRPQIRVVPGRMCAKEQTLLELQIYNPLYIPSLDCEWELEITNAFRGTSSKNRVFMPIHVHEVSDLCMPLQIEDVGRFTFSVSYLRIRDFFGLVRCKIQPDCSASAYVVPEKTDTEDIDVTEYLYGAAESEESDKKGNDCSEVSDIREYIPGDRIRDIHWKLSAKQDVLMVKERISMAGSEMVLVLQLQKDWEATRGILRYVYAVALEFAKIRTPVCIMCWNQGMFVFDEYRCVSEEELREAFCRLFDYPLEMRITDQLAGYFRNCYPFLNTYLTIGQKDGRLQMEMQENG